MGHAHSHAHHGHGPGCEDHNPNRSREAILWGFALNLGFACIEFVGGWWSGSLAILADAVHDLGDAASLAGALGLEAYAARRRDRTYSFGYRRFSLLSALLSGLIILGGSVLILRESIPRIQNPGEPHGVAMMWLSVVGLAVNGFAALKLSHGGTRNAQILSWHFWEDTLGWAATLLGGFAIHFLGWKSADPWLATGLALFISFNVFRHLSETVRLFLQGAPKSFDAKAFIAEACALPEVTAIHDLHAWSLDGERHVVSFHAVLSPELQKQGFAALRGVRETLHALCRKAGIHHTTIELEFEGEPCEENCDEQS